MIDEFLKVVESGNYTQALIILGVLLILFKGSALKSAFKEIFVYLKHNREKTLGKKDVVMNLEHHPVILGTARKRDFVLSDANLEVFAQFSQGVVDWQRRKKFVRTLLSIKFDVFNKALTDAVNQFNIAYLNDDPEKLGKVLSKEYWYFLLQNGIKKYKEETEKRGVPIEAIEVFERYHNTAETNIVKYIDQLIGAPLVSDEETMRGILGIFDFVFSVVKSDIGDILQLNGELSSSLKNMKI